MLIYVYLVHSFNLHIIVYTTIWQYSCTHSNICLSYYSQESGCFLIFCYSKKISVCKIPLWYIKGFKICSISFFTSSFLDIENCSPKAVSNHTPIKCTRYFLMLSSPTSVKIFYKFDRCQMVPISLVFSWLIMNLRIWFSWVYWPSVFPLLGISYFF